MEAISQSLQNLNLENLQSQSLTIPDSNSISVYKGELTKDEIGRQTARIIKSFPKIPMSIVDILKDRFIENNFNDERMIAAVNNVIDNYEGWDKIPNIANFIQFDRKVKIHSYTDFLEITRDMDSSTRTAWQNERVYKKIRGRDGMYYVLKTDYDNFKHLFEE